MAITDANRAEFESMSKEELFWQWGECSENFSMLLDSLRTLAGRIEDLERREALLTAFVAADDTWTLIDQVRDMADCEPRIDDEWMAALDKREAARAALDWFGDE